jgi:hypothetical protein
MTVPDYLQLPDPSLSPDDTVLNDGYYPNLSMAEFEQNYQVTDVFQGKTLYMLQSAKIAVNSQLSKTAGQTTLETALADTYRMCVYACAMMMICQRYGSVDTQKKQEYEQEKKQTLAVVYKNEYRRLLFILTGDCCEVTCHYL